MSSVRVETKPFNGPCPAGRRMADPCPCKPARTVEAPCNACLWEWTERAAIFEHDAGFSRADAERMATEQLMEALAKAEPGQRRLFG